MRRGAHGLPARELEVCWQQAGNWLTVRCSATKQSGPATAHASSPRATISTAPKRPHSYPSPPRDRRSWGRLEAKFFGGWGDNAFRDLVGLVWLSKPQAENLSCGLLGPSPGSLTAFFSPRFSGFVCFHGRALPFGRLAHPSRQQSRQSGCLPPLPSGLEPESPLSLFTHPSSPR